MPKKSVKKARELTTPKKTTNSSWIIGTIFLVIIVIIILSFFKSEELSKTGKAFDTPSCDADIDGKSDCAWCTEDCKLVPKESKYDPDKYECVQTQNEVCGKVKKDCCIAKTHKCVPHFYGDFCEPKTCHNECGFDSGCGSKGYDDCIKDNCCKWG